MNLTLYSAIAGLLLAIGAFFYGKHVGTEEGNLKLVQEQSNEYQSYIAYDKAIQTASKVAADQQAVQQYKFQSDVDSANVRARNADDTSSRLQHAFTLYADGGWFKNSAEDTACVPVSDANARVGLLAHDAGVLDADGLRASKGAAACAVRLTACEGWAATVIQEMAH